MAGLTKMDERPCAKARLSFPHSAGRPAQFKREFGRRDEVLLRDALLVSVDLLHPGRDDQAWQALGVVNVRIASAERRP